MTIREELSNERTMDLEPSDKLIIDGFIKSGAKIEFVSGTCVSNKEEITVMVAEVTHDIIGEKVVFAAYEEHQKAQCLHRAVLTIADLFKEDK